MKSLSYVSVLLALVSVVSCDGQIGGLPPIIDEEPEATGPRHGRRLSAPQLQQALIGATGFDYIGPARVIDHNAPQGYEYREDAALLEVYGASLGNPDYDLTTQAALDASITFSKLAEDGVRYACGQVAHAEVVDGAHPTGRPHLLIAAGPDLSLPADASAVRANIAQLALRYWGHEQGEDDEDTVALQAVFQAGYDAGAPEVDPEMPDAPVPDPIAARNAGGWRAVCIAMLSDARFLTY